MDARTAMAFGTAGFTAGLSVVALEERGLDPADGPVLVTGATGGVGSIALSMLASRGFEVWALTGKPDAHAWLTELGASGILSRDDAPTAGRPLDTERWAGAVDTVGEATLPYVLRTLKRRAAVAACGNASGAALATTVFPFILRGVALLGMDSAWQPMARRRRIWDRLATDLMPDRLLDRTTTVDLHGLEGALDAILRGEARGRWLVRVRD
jgi:acrylyl-CoA reductase (NADPH)